MNPLTREATREAVLYADALQPVNIEWLTDPENEYRLEKAESLAFIFRHPDPQRPLLSLYGARPTVGLPDKLPSAHADIQLMIFFDQASEVIRQYNLVHGRQSAESSLHIVDRLLSSPTLRVLLPFIEAIEAMGVVLGSDRRVIPTSSHALEKLIEKLTKEKLEEINARRRNRDMNPVQTALIGNYALTELFDRQDSKGAYAISQEVQHQLKAMAIGIEFHPGLLDLLGSDILHAGLDQDDYDKWVNSAVLTASEWTSVTGMLQDITNPKSGRIAIACTHGSVLTYSTVAALYWTRQHIIAKKAYGEIKSDHCPSFPNGSGGVFGRYANGEIKFLGRIAVPTTILKQDRKYEVEELKYAPYEVLVRYGEVQEVKRRLLSTGLKIIEGFRSESQELLQPDESISFTRIT